MRATDCLARPQSLHGEGVAEAAPPLSPPASSEAQLAPLRLVQSPRGPAPRSRRRAGWFEENAGCFTATAGGAVLAVCVAGAWHWRRGARSR